MVNDSPWQSIALSGAFARSNEPCADELAEGFGSAMTVMVLPEHLRKFYRTSNHIERLNRELKRRSKVIGIFPNESSLLRLMSLNFVQGRNTFATTLPLLFNTRKLIFLCSPKRWLLTNSATL